MLDLPDKFKLALGSGVRTSLFPVVVIGSDIYLSIKETTIGGKACDPLLLNSPSIKSSADIINNKYTISSVSLSISNANYHGKIFSDIIPDLLNEETKIYYCANGINELDDCLLVYTGKIRRYSQSAETIKLTLEDLTEEKLSTQIPVTKIPDEDEFRSEDVGKVYPMVYGRVDNSPTIIKASYDALNDELTEDITELILEKPSQEIRGAWVQSNEGDYGHEHLNNTEHILVRDNWIKLQNFFLSINDNGFLPVNQTIGKEWGENDLDEEATFYNFNNASDGTSANIRLSPINQEIDLNADGDSADDGEQIYGIPSRVYRPIDSVGFFNYEYESRLHVGDDYNEPRTANRFYSFTGDEKDTDLWDPRKETISSIDTEPYDDNQDCQAKDRYDQLFDGNNEPTDEFWSSGWWGATDVNLDSDADNNQQAQERAKTWTAVDVFWEALYGKSVARLPIDRIQDSSFDTGLHLNSKNTELEGGAFARIKVLDNIGDFPCFTKIVFQVTMYTCSPPSEGGIGSTGSRFWTDRNLIEIEILQFNNQFDCNTLDGILDYNDPAYANGANRPGAGDGVSVPFYEDQEISRDISDEGELGDYEGSFGLNKWSKTKAFDSIQWGAPEVRANGSVPADITPYHISDLCGVYVLQDILIDDLLSREYFASLEGRVKSNSNSIALIQDIAEDILVNELEFDGTINKTDEDDAWKFDFTLNEQKETKTVFQDLFNSSLLIPSFNSENEFRFINIHQTMSAEFIGGLRIIKNEDIVKYSFDLTKLDDVYSSVNVKYKKNYASGDFDKETSYSLSYNNTDYSNYQELSEVVSEADSYDIDYYHINHSDAKLEVETEYIRDKSTAERLQKRLLMWHINQHLIAKIDLPPHYMDLEAGDYIRFNELMGGKLAFGYDYTEPERRNGQLIYPVFFITKVSKSLTKVNIEAIQVHRGQFGYPEDDADDSGDVVNSEKVDVTDQFQLPDPNDDPDYQDDTIDDGFIDGDPVIIDSFNLYWLDAANRLDLSPITAILSTTNLTGWIYDIWIVNVETPDGEGIRELFNNELIEIEEGEHPIGTVDGDLLTFNSSMVVGNGGSINITKKMIFEEGTTIDFVLEVKSFDGDMSDTLTFKQLGEPPYVPLLGDVNDDGIINVLDVVAILSAILNWETENLPEQADINGDGVFDVLDIVGLLDYILTGEWHIIIDDGEDDDEDDDGTGGGE